MTLKDQNLHQHLLLVLQTAPPPPPPAEGSKPPSDELQQRRKTLLKEINRIDNWTNVAADNGLFDKQKK